MLAIFPFPAKPSMSRQQSIDSHAVPFIPQPGDEVGKKVAVPKGWFDYEGAGSSDPDELVLLTVTALDANGSKWDSRVEKRKGKKHADHTCFIVHPSVVSDNDDPRGYPMRISAYIAFREAMER